MFAQRLKEIRNKKGLTQLEAALKLDIAPRAYQYYESGSREPSLSNLTKIANVFDCSIDYLIGRTEKPDYVQVVREVKGIPVEMHIQKDSPKVKGEFTPEQLQRIEKIVEKAVEQRLHENNQG